MITWENREKLFSKNLSNSALSLSLSLSLKWRLESGNNRGSLTVLFSQVWYLSFPFPLSLSSPVGSTKVQHVKSWKLPLSSTSHTQVFCFFSISKHILLTWQALTGFDWSLSWPNFLKMRRLRLLLISLNICRQIQIFMAVIFLCGWYKYLRVCHAFGRSIAICKRLLQLGPALGLGQLDHSLAPYSENIPNLRSKIFSKIFLGNIKKI